MSRTVGRTGFLAALVLPVLIVVTWGCSKRLDKLFGIPVTGELLVETVTGGADLDPDGYEIRLSRADLDDRTESIGVNDLLVISTLVGNVTVHLEDVAANCAVNVNPQLTSIPENNRVRVTFNVACS